MCSRIQKVKRSDEGMTHEVIASKGELFKETTTFFDVEKAIEHAQKRESEGYSVKIRKISYIVWK